jgi:hypothetical protein
MKFPVVIRFQEDRIVNGYAMKLFRMERCDLGLLVAILCRGGRKIVQMKSPSC